MKKDFSNSEKSTPGGRLSAEDQRLLAILDSLLLGVMLIEPDDHRIVYVNAEAARMMDRTQADLLDQVCHDYICPCALGKCPITDLHQHIDRSTRFVIDGRGKEVPILKSVKQIWFDKREHLLETFMDIRDVTEKERLVGVLEMAGAAAHHLSQPLQALLFDLDDLKKSLPRSWSGRLQEMQSTAAQMRTTIKSIQDITRYRTTEYIEGTRIVDIDGAAASGRPQTP